MTIRSVHTSDLRKHFRFDGAWFVNETNTVIIGNLVARKVSTLKRDFSTPPIISFENSARISHIAMTELERILDDNKN